MGILIGDVFGKLTITALEDNCRKSGSAKRMAVCSCSCGASVTVEKYNLSSGNTTQCRLCSNESRSKKHVRHGNSISMKDTDPAGYNCYTRWQSMKRRCYKEYDSHYKNYGARGIIVCDRWLNSYENFLADMGLPPTKEHQIDRIGNDGNYEPSNCRWISRKENANNKTNNKLITAFGKTMTQAQWSEETGIKRETIAMRLRRGWSAELALSKK